MCVCVEREREREKERERKNEGERMRGGEREIAIINGMYLIDFCAAFARPILARDHAQR